MIINPGLQSRTVNLVTSNKKMLECMTLRGRGGGCYIGMCGPKGYGFSAVLVINRVWFLHSSLDLATFSSLLKRKSTKALDKLCLR